MKIRVAFLFAIIHCAWINVAVGLPATDGKTNKLSNFGTVKSPKIHLINVWFFILFFFHQLISFRSGWQEFVSKSSNVRSLLWNFASIDTVIHQNFSILIQYCNRAFSQVVPETFIIYLFVNSTKLYWIVYIQNQGSRGCVRSILSLYFWTEILKHIKTKWRSKNIIA